MRSNLAAGFIVVGSGRHGSVEVVPQVESVVPAASNAAALLVTVDHSTAPAVLALIKGLKATAAAAATKLPKSS